MRRLCLALCAPLLWVGHDLARAMDTDIFSINTNANAPAPNILIVLDNTSNWSRADQQWPGGLTQGQSEIAAIQQALAQAVDTNGANLNVGIMEYPTVHNDSAGYIRFAVKPIGSAQTNGGANYNALSNVLTTIYSNINASVEKVNSGQPYGNLMSDVYHYLAGMRPDAVPADVPAAPYADPAGYVGSGYTQFSTPLSAATGCATTYVIFIGNPNSKGPAADAGTATNSGVTNTSVLAAAGGDTTELVLQQVTGYSATTNMPIVNGTVADTAPWNADEWARFLYQKGVPVAAGANQYVATYTIDVYNAQPNAAQSELLASMARNGGGQYFAATSQAAINAALNTIFSEVLAQNSTFASASLPISATNRSQNDNQVYIGMFRPDTKGNPRWFGNMKRYELAVSPTGTMLADRNGSPAVSTTTGFINPCAVSWWTSDAGTYWANVSSTGSVTPRIFQTQETTPGTAWKSIGDDTDLARSGCIAATVNPFSDIPDGPTVEKGGAAELMRLANNRTIKTLSGGSLATFSNGTGTISANSSINANIVNFISGQDVTGEINNAASSANRPSIHGDVIHSRPLPIDYGGSTGVVVYYGANDGTFRAVNATSGSENWAFVAPEFFGAASTVAPNNISPLQRLLDNYPSISSTATKPFLFDGSTGVYAGSNNSPIYVFPSMRRGGRTVYGFDVTAPTNPKYLWKVGCPDLGDNNGCSSADFNAIGQTWSTPAAAFLNGYSATSPVVVMGGGYDVCEDQNASPAAVTGFCATTTGNAVFVIDATSGVLVRKFSQYLDNGGTVYNLPRSIVSDVSFADINQDGKVDAAYVADTGGNIYRIDFTDSNFNAVAPSNWRMTRVAYTTGGGRKFLFAPALLPYKGQVYVTISSGDREHPLSTDYPYTTPIVNRFYVLLDDPMRTTATNLDGNLMLDTTGSNDYALTGPGCNGTSILPTSGTGFRGWYLSLTQNGAGEQGVTSPLIVSGMVTFSTNRPLASGFTCASPLGEARGYWLNLLNGSGAVGVSGLCGGNRSGVFTGGGLPPTPVSGVVSINGKVQSVVLSAIQRDGTSSSPIAAQQTRPPTSIKRKRVYWHPSGDTH